MKRCTENSVMSGRTHRNHGGSGEGKISSREERNCEKWRGSWYKRRHLPGTLEKQLKEEPLGFVLSILFTAGK